MDAGAGHLATTCRAAGEVGNGELRRRARQPRGYSRRLCRARRCHAHHSGARSAGRRRWRPAVPHLSERRPMTEATSPIRPRLVATGLAIALAAGAGGYGIARWTSRPDDARPATQGADATGKALYWYDPMVPSQHFDKPGKSPFMDMQLVPKYAGGGDAPGVQIDPATSQTLGMRIVAVRRGELASSLTAAGTIDFNQRDVAIVQARAGGFVARVYGRAPGDVIGAGAPLADLLIPEWGGAQAEFLAVRRTGNAALTQAARQRLMLLGMPAGTIASVERTGRPHNVVTISTPTGGVIKTLDVRAGMTMSAGQTLAEINGLGTVWLNAAVPEAVAGSLKPGQTVQ